MNYLIYMSTSAKMFDTNDLTEILLNNRKNYTRKGITGMMLYSNGTILQALEGEAEDLEEVFAHLQCDDQHKGIIKLKSGKANTRAFTDWTMGVKASYNDTITKICGFINPLKYDFLDSYNEKHPAVSFLRSFAQYNLQY